MTDMAGATHAFQGLDVESSSRPLSNGDMLPNADQCLAHLKLLECFNQLREDVGGSDGLFGIRNGLVPPGLNDQKRSELLAKLCEKRWQVYVTRACLRFQSYWRSLQPTSKMLVEENLKADDYVRIASHSKPVEFTANNLPPLGKCLSWASDFVLIRQMF